MNIKRFLTLTFLMNIMLVSSFAYAKNQYVITFSQFLVNKESFYERANSNYIFYVYNPEKNTYESKCFDKYSACKRAASTTAGSVIPLNVKVSNVSDYVYLMMLELDRFYTHELFKTTTETVKWTDCPEKEILGAIQNSKACLKIPVEYLLKHQNSCFVMKSRVKTKEVCLYYKIEEQNQLDPDFENNLNALSSLSDLFDGQNLLDFFKKKYETKKVQKVEFVHFSNYIKKPVSLTTFYANGNKFSWLPAKIAKPVVDYLANKYPSGLWVVQMNNQVLGAYGADQLIQTENSSSIPINVNRPQILSKEVINDWLQTPKNNQVQQPYNRIKLSYTFGNTVIAERITSLNDQIDTVSETLNLAGRYILGKHLDIKVELFGMFSLFKGKVDANQNGGYSINLQQSSEKVPQIDLVAVFGNNYDFQQQAIKSILDLGNIAQTSEKELEKGWMIIWNKSKIQQLLRNSISQQSKNKNRSLVLHYLYNLKEDKDDWLWSSMLGQNRLKHAPIIWKDNLADIADISNVVLKKDIHSYNRPHDNQVNYIIDNVTQQWQPNGDYLLVILSDGISDQKMKELKDIKLPSGNGKRSLLILTSDFLPINSNSLLSLPKLPSNTGSHRVISLHDKMWVEQFVEAIFK